MISACRTSPTRPNCSIIPSDKVCPRAARVSHGAQLNTIQDQEVVAKLAELDMMVADLEHANSRVATVERRNVRGITT